MNFYDDMKKALLQAIKIREGNIPVKEKEDMPAKTYYVDVNAGKSENRKE